MKVLRRAWWRADEDDDEGTRSAVAESMSRKKGASSLLNAGPKVWGKNEGLVNIVRDGAAGLQTLGTTRAVMRPYGCIGLVGGVIVCGCDR